MCYILGMKGFGPIVWRQHIFLGEPSEIQHPLIDVERPSFRVQDRDCLRYRIDDLSELSFTRAECFLGLLSIIDVSACTVPPDDLAGFVAQWLCANQKPAIDSVTPAKTRLDLVRFSRDQHLSPFVH